MYDGIRVLNLYHFGAPPALLLRLILIIAFPADGMRRSCPDFFASGISVTKLNILIERIALKIVFEDKIPTVLALNGKRQIVFFIFQSAVLFL